jgi:uncharacterized protein YdaU (DUF1376 family)
MYMTPAEVGAYVLLLAEQWRNGFVYEQTPLLLRVSRMKNRRQLAQVLSKFEVCEDGHLRNRKMESIRCDRIGYINEQSRKGKLSAANRGSTAVIVRLQPEGQPEVNSASASASASEEEEEKDKPTGKRSDTWMTDFGTAWKETFGGELPFKKFARALKRVVDDYGNEKELAGFKRYCKETPAEYANAASFAQKAGVWINADNGKPKQTELKRWN